MCVLRFGRRLLDPFGKGFWIDAVVITALGEMRSGGIDEEIRGKPFDPIFLGKFLELPAFGFTTWLEISDHQYKILICKRLEGFFREYCFFQLDAVGAP